jgi:hypothetical protein
MRNIKIVLHSYTRNLDQILIGSVKWPAGAVRLLLLGRGVDEIFQTADRSAAPIYKIPTNREMIIYLARLTRNIARKQLSDLFGTSELARTTGLSASRNNP